MRTRKLLILLLQTAVLLGTADAQKIRALPEWARTDPFGEIVQVDKGEGPVWQDAVRIEAARGSYVSVQLVVTGGQTISVRLPFSTEIYREWFHRNTVDGKFYPDALVPVDSPRDVRVTAMENAIPGQTARVFWVDVWIPSDAKPGLYQGSAAASSPGHTKSLPIRIRVLPRNVPEKDALTIDNNSYGVGWMRQQYPEYFIGPVADAHETKLIHAYHRVFDAHRTIFHQLGYSHLGEVTPGFAPELTGTGEGKHIANWKQFDDIFGPLLDGSALKENHRGARPIQSLYLPINAGWPANELWWGKPGYEAEFSNVVREMEVHFREHGWTHTRLEVFFNQKKRYKGFAWDGDEARFPKDDAYLQEYSRMLKASLPQNTPVPFVLRADSSWRIGEQSKSLGDDVRLWVVNAGMASWYEGDWKRLKQSGATVWTYGGTPAVQESLVRMTVDPLRAWVVGADGFVRWLTVDPGPQPWTALKGGDETLVYPGERFGIEAPLPSIRLKVQRNLLQDLALLQARADKEGADAVRRKVVKLYNGSTLESWHNSSEDIPKGKAEDWSNADINDGLKAYESRFSVVKPSAWSAVHQLALGQETAR